MSDQERISPYNISAILTRWVMRIKKIINLGMISWSNKGLKGYSLKCSVTGATMSNFSVQVII